MIIEPSTSSARGLGRHAHAQTGVVHCASGSAPWASTTHGTACAASRCRPCSAAAQHRWRTSLSVACYLSLSRRSAVQHPHRIEAGDRFVRACGPSSLRRARSTAAHALWPRASVRRELSELGLQSTHWWPRPSATACYTLAYMCGLPETLRWASAGQAMAGQGRISCYC